MGYESNFRYEISGAKIDLSKLDEFHEYWKNDLDEEIYGFYGAELDVDDDGNLKDIILDDYDSKFYDCEKFVNSLSDILINGEVILYFYGEDGYSWAYKISPGKIDAYDAVFVEVNDVEKLNEKGIKFLDNPAQGF